MKSEKVLDVVKKIPRGKVSTYKELAKTAKTHPRAVGTILHSNKDFSVPCYRVVRSDGRIGGYNRGVAKKILLLRRDGSEIKNGKIDLKKYFYRFS